MSFHKGEKQGKGGKNPKRVGADFHYNLKKQGLLDKDDDDWLVSTSLSIVIWSLFFVEIGCHHLVVFGTMVLGHIQSTFFIIDLSLSIINFF